MRAAPLPDSDLEKPPTSRALLRRQCSSVPLGGDDDPEQQVGQEARRAAWDHQDQEKKAEPEGADAEKGAQAAAHACYYAVLPSQSMH